MHCADVGKHSETTVIQRFGEHHDLRESYEKGGIDLLTFDN